MEPLILKEEIEVKEEMLHIKAVEIKVEKEIEEQEEQKGFTREIYLVKHEPILANEKSYQCSLRDKAFSQNEQCTVHQRIHTQKMLCEFSKCNKNSLYENSFKKYLGTHTRDKPYKCGQCDKAFSQNTNPIPQYIGSKFHYFVNSY
ncbi:unnamed protein product, partial [Meganyctiphanes norvegica]